MKTLKQFILTLIVITSIVSCATENKADEKIKAYSIDTFNGMLNNDKTLFYKHFLSKNDYEKSNKKMRPVKEKDRNKALLYFSNKLKKRVGSTDGVKLTHIIVSEPQDQEVGQIKLIYRDNNGQYYDYSYLKFIKMNEEIYLSIGNDDFHQIDLKKQLDKIKSSKYAKIIQLEE